MSARLTAARSSARLSPWAGTVAPSRLTPDTWARKGPTARTSMPVMTQTTRRITYRGHPSGAPMLAEMLKREGVTVEPERPNEQRNNMADLGLTVVEGMVAAGAYDAIKAGIRKFLEFIHDKGWEATVEDDDPED